MIRKHLENINRFDPDTVTRSGDEYLRLDMNEGVSLLPEEIIVDITKKINSDYISTYPSYKNLKNLLAKFDSVDTTNVCLTNGSDCAIKYIFETFVEPGNKVLITDPTFAMYPVYGNIYNAVINSVTYNDDLSFPFKKYIEAIDSETKLVVIVNPNNPTGSVLEIDKITVILEKAKSNNAIVVIDEAYYLFYPESMACLIAKYNNLIVTRTFSKVFGMAALRLGYILSNNKIINYICKIKPTFDVNGLAVLFAEQVLSSNCILDDMIAKSKKGKDFICKKFADKNITYIPGNANFILIELSSHVDDILNELTSQKILVSGGFKQPFLKQYLRVTTASETIMDKFWTTFEPLYDRYFN